MSNLPPSRRRSLNPFLAGSRRLNAAGEFNAMRRHRPSRLSHIRHSIAAPISNFLGHVTSSEEDSASTSRLVARRHSTSSSRADAPFRPSEGAASRDTLSSRGGDVSPRTEGRSRRRRRSVSATPPSSSSPPPPLPQSDTSSLTLAALGDRQLGLENNPTLARILAIAASAISAQASENDNGSNGNRITPAAFNNQVVGENTVNESLRTIINSLQQDREHANEGDEEDEETGQPRNINYVRAFLFDNNDTVNPLGRFGDDASQTSATATATATTTTTSTTTTITTAARRSTEQSDGDAERTNNELYDNDDEESLHEAGASPDRRNSTESTRSRTVTLIIVGVRAMRNVTMPPHDVGTGPEIEATGVRESNTSRHRLRASNLLRSATMSTRETGRSFRARFPFRRRRESASQQSGPGTPSRNPPSSDSSGIAEERFIEQDPAGAYDSPPGPAPPPTTPADPSVLSAPPSHSVTPRRLSSVSSTLGEEQQQQQHDGADDSQQDSTVAPFVHVRQRSRSDSEPERRRFGAGSSRRNGIVEPDDTSSGNPSAGRSWLIYVIGTNLSENHPALLMPSLFTNSPTYEDMIMLSTLMGQAKPPVASESDVAGAGGLYIVMDMDGELIAELLHAEDQDELRQSIEGLSAGDPCALPKRIAVHGEQCLVCLSEYEPGEEIRRLPKCKHMFHQPCIDQWLTTGRNTCPMCREQGVSETTTTDPASEFGPPNDGSDLETPV
ncbi:hypothetical protein KEM56_005620 [Ascosphaera pollenicola]|nr:hypothetical protein KEM56_005620 [Ascosphaera pollenicola]